MNEIIVNFWAKKGLHVEKLIAKRPSGLRPEQVSEAAVLVCGKVTKGEINVPDIKLAREVWSLAKTIQVDSQTAEYRRLLNAKETIDELSALLQIADEGHEELKQEITRNHYWWAFVSLSASAGSFCIGYVL